MDVWKQVISEGNVAFSSSRIEESIVSYKQACKLVCQMPGEWFAPEDMVAAMAVSYQNLADAYLKLGEEVLALKQYARLSRLLEGYRQQYTQVPGVTDAVLGLQRRLGAELYQLISEQNSPADCGYRIVNRLFNTSSPLRETSL